jgi:hypothetical protein
VSSLDGELRRGRARATRPGPIRALLPARPSPEEEGPPSRDCPFGLFGYGCCFPRLRCRQRASPKPTAVVPKRRSVVGSGMASRWWPSTRKLQEFISRVAGFVFSLRFKMLKRSKWFRE